MRYLNINYFIFLIGIFYLNTYSSVPVEESLYANGFVLSFDSKMAQKIPTIENFFKNDKIFKLCFPDGWYATKFFDSSADFNTEIKNLCDRLFETYKIFLPIADTQTKTLSTDNTIGNKQTMLEAKKSVLADVLKEIEAKSAQDEEKTKEIEMIFFEVESITNPFDSIEELVNQINNLICKIESNLKFTEISLENIKTLISDLEFVKIWFASYYEKNQPTLSNETESHILKDIQNLQKANKDNIMDSQDILKKYLQDISIFLHKILDETILPEQAKLSSEKKDFEKKMNSLKSAKKIFELELEPMLAKRNLLIQDIKNIESVLSELQSPNAALYNAQNAIICLAINVRLEFIKIFHKTVVNIFAKTPYSSTPDGGSEYLYGLTHSHELFKLGNSNFILPGISNVRNDIENVLPFLLSAFIKKSGIIDFFKKIIDQEEKEIYINKYFAALQYLLFFFFIPVIIDISRIPDVKLRPALNLIKDISKLRATNLESVVELIKELWMSQSYRNVSLPTGVFKTDGTLDKEFGEGFTKKLIDFDPLFKFIAKGNNKEITQESIKQNVYLFSSGFSDIKFLGNTIIKPLYKAPIVTDDMFDLKPFQDNLPTEQALDEKIIDDYDLVSMAVILSALN